MALSSGDVPQPLSNSRLCLVETSVGSMWLPTEDDLMRPHLEKTQKWKGSTTDLVGKLLRGGGRFLDVGASVGWFSLVAAQTHSRVSVTAVEANPRLTPALHFNLWMNGVVADLWPVALGDRKAAATMESCSADLGSGVVSRPREGQTYDTVIPMLTADDLFAGRTFDVVKVNASGGESSVILGMHRIIRNSPTIRIVVTFWPKAIRDAGADPMDELDRYRSMGLEITANTSSGLQRLTDREVVEHCDTGGEQGRLDLLLRVP